MIKHHSMKLYKVCTNKALNILNFSTLDACELSEKENFMSLLTIKNYILYSNKVDLICLN